METYLIIFEDNVVCEMYDERGTSHILPRVVSNRMYVLIAYVPWKIPSDSSLFPSRDFTPCASFVGKNLIRKHC